MGIRLFSYRGLQGDGLLCDLQRLADSSDRDVHASCDFLRGRGTAQLLHELAGSTEKFVDDLDHVHGNTDRTGLIGDSPGNGLADPPRRVGRELVAAPIVELVNGLHQANITFLDQVQELQASICVFLGNGNDKPKIGFDKVALGILRLYIALNDLALSSMELLKCDVGCLFEFLEVRRANPLLASAFSSDRFATRTLTF